MLNSDPYMQATEVTIDRSACKCGQRTPVEHFAQVLVGMVLLVEGKMIIALDAAAALTPC